MCSANDLPAYDLPDKEWVDPRDRSCDMCGKTIFDGSLRAESLGGSVLFKCGACRERDQARYRAMTGDDLMEYVADAHRAAALDPSVREMVMEDGLLYEGDAR